MSEELKDQGLIKFNELLEKKNYDLVIEHLEKLNTPKELMFFHKAFISYDQGDLVGARILLEKAKLNGFYSPEVKQALEVVKRDLQINYIESDQSFIDKFVVESKSVSDLFYPTVSLFFLLLMIGLWAKKFKILSLLMLSISILSISFYGYLTFISLNISKDENIVRTGPSRIFEEAQKIPAGLRFVITKKYKDWSYVDFPKDYRGWIYQLKATEL